MKNTQSRFFCCKCGKEGIPIQRKQCSQREPGHLKKLYCIFCQEEVNHAEVREIGGYTVDDFKLEFELGRFINGQRIPNEELISCSDTLCKYNIEGKCWNSNYSYNCGHRPIKEEVDTNEIS